MATKGKDLRSGRSVWQGRRASHVAHECLARDLKTDVLIMGAGITGAAIATGGTHRSSLSLARSEKKRPSGGGHYRRGDRRPSRCRFRSLPFSSPQVAVPL